MYDPDMIDTPELDDVFIDEFDTDIDEISQDVIEELDKLEEQAVQKEQEKLKENESKKKKKRQKKPVDPFVTFTKKYFSSMCARNGKYVIFNLDNDHLDKIILVSSRGKFTFEDYLLQYYPGDLALQIVTFKKNQFKFIKEKLCVPDNKFMLYNVATIRKAINTAIKDKENPVLPLKIAKDDNDVVYVKYKDITKPTEEFNYTNFIEKIGFQYTDWRTICILRKLVNQMEHQNDTDCVVKERIIFNEDLEQRIYQNVLIYPIQTNRFRKNDELLFPNFSEQNHTQLVFIDGKDIVSLKEYVKKLKTDYKLKIYAIVKLPDKHIFYLSVFEDEDIRVICSRPFTCTYPFVETLKENTHVE